MNKEQEWTYYWRAAWNLDQATHVARLLMDSTQSNPPYEERRIRCAALDFCVVSYCSPFLNFNIEGKKRIKGISREDFVPPKLDGIHDQVFTYRDKEIAHTDISHLSVPDFGSGDRFITTRTYTNLPNIEECFRLFDFVRIKVTKKFEELNNEGLCQQGACHNAGKPAS